MEEEQLQECICAEYDTRGYSVCGVKCPLHPPNALCMGTKGAIELGIPAQVCKSGSITHNGIECFACLVLDEKHETMKLLRITPEPIRKQLQYLAERCGEESRRRTELSNELIALKRLREVDKKRHCCCCCGENCWNEPR